MWVHNSSTEQYTYLSVHQKRGIEGMEANGVLNKFLGVAVHDCWKSYWKYDIIIDSMMNIPILYWASKVTDDDRFAFGKTAIRGI